MSAEIETIQKPLALWLAKQGIPFINPRSDKESGLPVGWPDFTIFFGSADNPQPVMPLFIECKDKETRITQGQELCHAYLRAAGHTVVIARSLASALEAIQTWQSTGIVRNAALGHTERVREGIHKDGQNGDFVYRYVDGFWKRHKRASFDDLKLPRVDITKPPQ